MSYLVRNGKAIAHTADRITGGKYVRFSTELCREEIDANRDYNLVNYKTAKISNNKRYDKFYLELPLAQEINPNEYYICPKSLLELYFN